MTHVLRNILTALTTALLAAATATAVEPTWCIDFETVFDNREGDNSITDTRTFFFTNLAAEAGVRFSDSDRIAAGLVWNLPIDNEKEGRRLSPTLYYRHHSRRWSASLGMFPRTQLQQELPGFLWSDSLAYFQRNIRGAMLQYHSPEAFFDFYLDWRQMQTESRREAFNIVFHGQWRPGAHRFFIGGHAMMNHFALSKNSPSHEHIVDNFLVNPYMGLDLGSATPLDSLSVRAGAVITVERNRAFGNWTAPAGGWLELLGEWRWLGLKNSLYAGGRLLPSYGMLGADLYQGELFYSTRFYNRTDLYARIIRNRWIELQASLNFNVTPGSFIFYQRLTLRVYLDRNNCPLFRKKS